MKYIVDIKGEIEGDYEIIGKYEERPQGEWVTVHFLSEDDVEIPCEQCSNCKLHFDIGTKFCPYCGADMRGGAE